MQQIPKRSSRTPEHTSAADTVDNVETDVPRRPLTSHQQRITDNLSQLLEVLPPIIRRQLEQEPSLDDLLEIVMDLGRIPEARFPERVVELGVEPITAEDIDYVVGRVGAFGKDNRAGIERTLHRISAIRNRQGRVVGLTCRIGRAVYGTIDIIQDVVESGKSILMLGRPGRGKTTKLREVARVLSEELKKRVVIVDTSNEIAGDGDIPHPAIGRARRMQVATPEQQHNVMIEAVENHMPEVIVIDEIGTEQEAFAARTIAERGVQLVGTAHGNSLENLMMNPTLSDLVGGIHAVTLSDDEAKRRGTQKTVLERKAPPTFDVIIEIMEVDKLALHTDVEKTVDRLLRGAPPRPEIRVRNDEGQIEVIQRSDDGGSGIREMPDEEYYGGTQDRRSGRTQRIDRMAGPLPDRENRGERARSGGANGFGEEEGGLNSRMALPGPGSTAVTAGAATKPLPATVRIFPYGVSRSRLDRAIAESHVPAYIARDVTDADVVVALKATYKREPGKMREAAQKRLPVYVVKSNTYAQIAGSIREIFRLGPAPIEEEEDEMSEALQEAQDAIDLVKQTNEAVELAPANSYTRRMQHQLVERYQLISESVGVEPQRRVRILPVNA
jgi:stage III sporulation protein SpoIIIAA